MPTTRRSTGGPRARPGPTKGQSTISFANRVTKSVSREGKKAISTPITSNIAAPTDAISEKQEVVDVPLADDVPTEEEPDVEPEEVPVVLKSETELEAEKVSDAQVNSYWKSVESQRKAPQVHQEGLDVTERVLRYFDVSSQYGPCIGVSRIKRWHRAERLGLNPPIEVLAVLLRGEKEDGEKIETAHMDQILNSIVLDA
ncbi:DNA polymerase delta subunit 4 [Drechmeria coniospora]|uniref:DNA polymerase delta subunit 4 n=1 Tax=Drechmeria coniospora TaxID=98403 RepID=A0A151GDX7_DRECN|nr:DNA polymerase delta subunit 4 [Drechmeria coniospora]KYK55296.1 DNA polymerase delta subunit 4 [Drechmeria coniospora]ODA82090.2 hypothetical protein RJ55_00595 [Drechmeria coniospora]